MKRNLIFLILACCSYFLVSCQEKSDKTIAQKNVNTPKKSAKARTNQLTPKEIKNGWQLLFDGESLEHWKGYNLDSLPPEGWQVENEEILGTGGGDLITKEQYQNFEFQLDFKLSEAANSGIFYFAQEIANQPIYQSAPEFQLIDNETYLNSSGADVMHKHLSGDAFNLYDGLINPGIVKNKWHTAKIISLDGHIEHWLNRKLCIEYDWGSPEWKATVASTNLNPETFANINKGHIGLQFWANGVRFRNLKVRRL